MKAEYIEGDKARENFERFAQRVLQAGSHKPPKQKRQPDKATARKTHGKNKG